MDINNMSEETKPSETGVIRDEKGLFQKGTAPGPGREKETEDEIFKKRALKKIIKDYEEKLTEILPEIPGVLRTEAKKGNMIAIKEINDRVLGKSLQRMANADGSNLIPDPLTPEQKEKLKNLL